MRRLKQFFLIMLLSLQSSVAFAYGARGHEVVGAIADQLLTPVASQQVTTILGMPLQVAATWPDCVKDVSGTPAANPTNFKYTPTATYHEACKAFETPDGIARMEDYVRRNWANCTRLPTDEVCHKQYHYSDVAIEHDHYDRIYKGTSDHDIVSAINAAIAVLQGNPAPPPFSIADKKEAILLLAHFVGDVHQPLHVGAIYLDANDQAMDPDQVAGDPDPTTETVGGNAISDGSTNLHADWDNVLNSLDPASVLPAMLTDARAVTTTSGDIASWASSWASETIVASHAAFTGISFSHAGQPAKHWKATFTDRAGYLTAKNSAQSHLITLAGARLAQVLNATLGGGVVAPTGTVTGYLQPSSLHLDTWLPARPVDDSLAEAADVQGFFASRSLIGTARGDEAALDDVYDAQGVAKRFSATLGKTLDSTTAPKLLAMMARVQKDSDAYLAAVKKSVAAGGRHRPFVDYPGRSTCPITFADLGKSGAYPSGHAALGWLWGSILAEIAPDQADALFARSVAFGDSRVVCGFHYPSDVQAGRLTAASLIQRLHADAAFQADLALVKQELGSAP